MASHSRDSGNAARVRARRSLAQMPHKGSGIDIDKENFTTDFNAVPKPSSIPSRTFEKEKRSRSKSLGPGGLDLLRNGGNGRRKSTAAVQLKSILKPTIPVSPIRNIPTFAETRRKTPSQDTTRSRQKAHTGNDYLIDIATPSHAQVIGTETLINPFDNFNPLPISQTGDVSPASREAKEEEERLERAREKKKAILEQRAARRKSMANRRVSFAPEATLHTWNVVELMEDSTASSAANTTRRASSLTTENDRQNFDVSEPPSSPERYDQFDAPISHATSDMNDAVDEAFSSSPFSGGSVADNNEAGFQGGNLDADSDSMSSEAEEEINNMEMENATEQSLSPQSDGSTPTSSSLERALRKAAETAGTRGIEFDENGDLSMEFTNHEIVGAFQPWVKKGASAKFDPEDLTSRLDQENIAPAKTAIPKISKEGLYIENDGDMSMDITRPLGGIVHGGIDMHSMNDRDSPIYPTMHTSQAHVRRMSAVTNLGDQTMEFTNVLGGIKDTSPARESNIESNVDTDEEMTMEFTNVLGGVLNNDNPSNDTKYTPQRDNAYERDVVYPELGEVDMEMTGAVGGILPPIDERTEPSEDGTMGMDMTNAVGKILAPFHFASKRSGMEPNSKFEADPPSSPFQENIAASPSRLPLPLHVPTVSESGSPIQTRPRFSTGSRRSVSPDISSFRHLSPAKSPSTPLKQKPINNVGPSTPTHERSPINPNSKSASPKKRQLPPVNQPSAKSTPISLFRKNVLTGQSTPTFVLKALNPNVKGINFGGLGSPRVAEILDRRRSIGEDAQDFVLKPNLDRGVRFDDPGRASPEIEKETVAESSQEAQKSEKDATLNLRDMISSLTPKKNKLRGRKSLHVGAARGLLGKRPVELDLDETEEDLTPKRLRGREASPVKNIKLPAPPSKAETVGRPNRLSLHYGRSVSPFINVSPTKEIPQLREPLSEIPDATASAGSVEATEDRTLENNNAGAHAIKLSEFLEMTNIQFMELTTTKRRHTIAPGSPAARDSKALNDRKEFELEDRAAAGFCTLPMLELYQHSCRELKSYISEGRRIIRSIEVETLAENPPLFQEYITATPDIKLLMDNQFRNVKTHARLLSKEMWYEWRMKLLEGLKQGLDRHISEMKRDDTLLSKKETILAEVVPNLIEKHDGLEIEAQNLQKVMDDIQNCDQEELQAARERLLAIESDLGSQKEKFKAVRNGLQEKDDVLRTAQVRREELLKQIHDAESVKEECRGWDVKEVRVLQDSVLALERKTGWTVISAKPGQNNKSHPAISMRYAGELRLDFDPRSLRVTSPNMTEDGHRKSPTVALTFFPGRSIAKSTAVEPSPEISLILHAIRTRITHSKRVSISPKLFLKSVAKSWTVAASLREEIRMLGYCGITTVKSAGATPSEPVLLKVRCTLLGNAKEKSANASEEQSRNERKGRKRARVDIDFTIKPKDSGEPIELSNMEISIDVDASAVKVYGFENSVQSEDSDSTISDFLVESLDNSTHTFGSGLWRAAVKSVEQKIYF